MTGDQADQRILLSKSTVSGYFEMTTTGVDPMPGTLWLIHDEIAFLEQLAAEHPRIMGKLMVLIGDWMLFPDRLRAKLN